MNTSFHGMHRLFPFLALLIVPALLAGQPYALHYQFQTGKTYRYKKTESTRAFTQTQTGLSADLNREVETHFSIRPQLTGEKLAYIYLQDTAFVDDRSQSQPFSAGTMDFQNILTKKPVKVTVSKRGELHAVEPLVPLSEGLNLPPGLSENVLARGASVLPLLPLRELKIGLTWTDEVKDTTRPRQDVPELGGQGHGVRYTSATTTYNVEGIETLLGYSCLKITWDGTLFVEGKMIFPSRESFNEERTKATGELYFAPAEGLLVQVKTTTEKEGTTAIYAAETAILPSNSTTTITTTLLPN